MPQLVHMTKLSRSIKVGDSTQFGFFGSFDPCGGFGAFSNFGDFGDFGDFGTFSGFIDFCRYSGLRIIWQRSAAEPSSPTKIGPKTEAKHDLSGEDAGAGISVTQNRHY